MGWPSPRKMPKAKRVPATTTAATLQETLEAAIEQVAAKVPAGPAQLGEPRAGVTEMLSAGGFDQARLAELRGGFCALARKP
jgi:hypothetical protein